MKTSKKISPVGMGIPTRESIKSSTESITDNSEKIKPFENINQILGKLTEVLQLTDKCCDVVKIEKIGGDSGIAAIHDIVKFRRREYENQSYLPCA